MTKTARKDGKSKTKKGECTMATIITVVIEDAKEAEERKIAQQIEQIKELEEIIKEAKAEVEKLEGEIKTEMMKRNTEEMPVGKYIVRWTEVLSNRFDSTAFKRVMPELYKAYTKPSVSRRFTISG